MRIRFIVYQWIENKTFQLNKEILQINFSVLFIYKYLPALKVE